MEKKQYQLKKVLGTSPQVSLDPGNGTSFKDNKVK